MHSYGVKNVIAILGSSMSKRQSEILLNSGAKKLALMLDSDEAGVKASLRIKSMFNKEFDISRILTDKKDPDSISMEEFHTTIAPQIRAI
jgi:DNA primase